MKRLAILFCLIPSSVGANELQFGFKSPAFNGVGYSSHVLTIDNQEQTRRQKIIDDKIGRAHV